MFDTHAHVHFDAYDADRAIVLQRAKVAGVDQLLHVGVDEVDSARAVDMASPSDGIYASVGLHPHEASRGPKALKEIADMASNSKVVAIGECGLDYYRNLSSHEDQISALRFQIELALRLDKALIFHVRDAFDDFFSVIDQYSGIRGVLHSFTDSKANAMATLDRGLFIALNGIMTFTKDQNQLEAAKVIPQSRLLLETDCPFLSPPPHRGHRNEPANLEFIAQFLANLRGEDPAGLKKQTALNASQLFGV